MFEHWDAGGGESYLYVDVDDFELARDLRKHLRYATYSRLRGGVFAWQFRMPTRRVRFIVRDYTLKSKELRGASQMKLGQGEGSSDQPINRISPRQEPATLTKYNL